MFFVSLVILALTAATAAPARPAVVSGSTPGSFSVSSNGAASFDLALQAPPGTHGLQPSLSVQYSSSSSNGFLGAGFSLGGLGQITRTGRTFLEDGQKGGVNYDGNDRFVMSGGGAGGTGRLININSVAGGYGGAGALYRTEQESWQRIVANGTCGSGPCSFTVTLGSGMVQQYAQAVPAIGKRFESAPLKGSARAWLLTSVTDLNGNSLTIDYTAVPRQVDGSAIDGGIGVLYPSQITWTANAAAGLTARRSLQFFYAPRPDLVESYSGGALARSAALLAHVRTFITPGTAPVLVADYGFTYETGPTGRSRLASIVQCDGGGVCLPATTFQWTDGPTGFVSVDATLPNIDSNEGWVGDFNGDGRTDILSVQPATVSCLALTTGYGFQCGSPLNLQLDQTTLVADFNGDGRADVFSGNGSQATLYYSNAAGVGTTGTSVPIPYLGDITYSADFNGDGLSDLYTGTSTSGSVALATTSGFQSTPLGPFSLNLGQGRTTAADFNGDGMADFFSGNDQSGTLYLSSGAAFTAINVDRLQLDGDTFLVADFDGDSLPDLLSATSATAYVSYATGNGFTPAIPVQGLQTQQGLSWPADYNGDGRMDIYVSNGDGGTIYYSVAPQRSGALFKAATIGNQNIQSTSSWLGDFNGDGIADFYNSDPGILWLGGPAGASSPPASNQLADLLTSVQTGAGAATTITYKPMTDPSVYAPAPTTTAGTLESVQLANKYSYTPLATTQASLYPVTPYRGALYLVSSYALQNVASVNAQSYSYSYSYQYAGALYNLLGRGWLGFASTTKFDPQLQARKTTTYAQEFPYNTQPLTQSTCSDAGSASPCTATDSGFLAQTVTAYSCTDTLADAACVVNNAQYSASTTRVYEVLKKSVTRNYGPWGSTSTTGYTYDLYGNTLTTTHTGTTPDSTLYQCDAYFNDVQAWRIGFPTESKTSSASGCPAAGEWNGYQFTARDLAWSRTTYDGRMNIVRQVQWDDGNNVFFGMQYGHDPYGNVRTTSTVSHARGAAAGVVPNTTRTTTYDPTYQTFPATRTTPLANPAVSTSSLQTASLYDPRFGVQVGELNATGYVMTTCLDGFGRTVLRQGPQPLPGGPVDENCLAAAAGTFDVPASFSSAKVVTTGTTTRSPAGSSTAYVDVSSRVDWTKSSPWLTTRTITDGLGRAVRTESPSDTPNVSIVTQRVFLDERLPSQVSLPYFSNASPLWETYTRNALGQRTVLTIPFASTSGPTTTMTWVYCPGNTVIETTNPSPAVTCAAPVPTSYATQTVSTFDNFHRGPRRLTQSQTDDQGALTTYHRDALGRVVTQVAPASRVDGTRVATTTPRDSLGRQSALTVTGALNIRYTYSPSTGLLDHQVDAMGQKMSFQYDGLNRLLTRSAYAASGQLSRTATFTYDTATDPKGQPNVKGRTATATMTDNANGNALISSYAWGYDPYGHRTATRSTVGGATYVFARGWNALGSLTALVAPNGMALQIGLTPGGNPGTYTVTPRGGAPTVHVTKSGYNAAGSPGTIAYHNGASETLTYTPQNSMLTHRLAEASGALSLNDGYVWDATGNPLHVYDCNYSGNAAQSVCAGISGTSATDDSETYGYTARRLTSASGAAGTFSYGYDANGNLISLNGATMTYDGYQLDSGTDGFQASYDGAGGMITRTPAGSDEVWTQTFDPESNLVSLSLDGTLRRAYQYDQTGRRVTATAYAADGTTVQSSTTHVSASYRVTRDADGTAQTFFIDDSGGHLVALTSKNGGAPAATYFHRDHVLSTVRVTGGAGTELSRVDYEPFGAPKVSNAASHDAGPLFDGRTYDEGTALFDFNSRTYDPASGQFLSADRQISGPRTRQDTLQRYTFGWNAPMTWADPSGAGPGTDALIAVTARDFLELVAEDDMVVDETESFSASESGEDDGSGSGDSMSDDDQGSSDDGMDDESSDDDYEPPTPRQWIRHQSVFDRVPPTGPTGLTGLEGYGSREEFLRVTARGGIRTTVIQDLLEEALADGVEFKCPTCPTMLSGKDIVYGGRLRRDFDGDHIWLTDSQRRELVLNLNQRGMPPLQRENWLDFENSDLRLQCPTCNQSHAFEPKLWERFVGQVVYASQLPGSPYVPPPTP